MMLIIRSDGDAMRTTVYCNGGVLRVTLQRDLYFGSLDPLDDLDNILAAQRLLDEREPLLLGVGRDRGVAHLGCESVVESDAENLHRDRSLGLELHSNLAID
jgi:hypothetical protein